MEVMDEETVNSGIGHRLMDVVRNVLHVGDDEPVSHTNMLFEDVEKVMFVNYARMMVKFLIIVSLWIET